MTNITSIPAARRPLANMIACVHQDNPILKAAVRSHRASTIFPTTLPIPEAEQAGLYRGYYLRCADGHNYWIGRDKQEAQSNFDKATTRHLKPGFGYGYDVEFSFGHVIGGGPAWINMSSADEFV